MLDFTQYFEYREKEEQEKQYFLKPDRPECLYELVSDIHAHFDALPNNWIYQIIYEAFAKLKDLVLDQITIESDPYYSDLYKWFGNSFAHDICNEVLKSHGSIIKDIYGTIGSGQWLAKTQIYQFVDDFLNEQEKGGENV